MSASTVIMPHTGDQMNYLGDPFRADGFYGYSEGLHTVTVQVRNFTGRIWIQASLVEKPTEDDWFDLWLTANHPYVEYPQIPQGPNTEWGGDTGTYAFNIQANVLWIRAKMSREYLGMPSSHNANLGSVSKIVLSR